MRFVSTKDELLKGFGVVVGSLPQKPNLPILNNFLLEATKGRLKVIATDLDSTTAYEIPVKVEKEGRTTIPGRLVVGFCQAATSDKISVEVVGEKATVRTGNAEAKLQTISPDEFPPTTDFVVGEEATTSKASFSKAIPEVCVCASPEGGRPILTGVVVKPHDKGLELVATDGYRLARKRIRSVGYIDGVVPSRALLEISKALAAEDDEEVTLAVNKEINQVQTRAARLEITTRLLEGDYPNYEQIIPQNYSTEISADTKDLIDALKQTAILSRDLGNVVGLEIRGGKLSILANTAEVGEARAEVAAKTTGEDIKTAFNSKFLLDSLSVVKTGSVVIKFSGSTSAALVQGVGTEDLIHLVMPVRTQG